MLDATWFITILTALLAALLAPLQSWFGGMLG